MGVKIMSYREVDYDFSLLAISSPSSQGLQKKEKLLPLLTAQLLQSSDLCRCCS